MIGFFFKQYFRMSSLAEKIKALPTAKAGYIENTNGKRGYMDASTNSGENKIEYQRIGPKVIGGSFIRLESKPDGNCFFSALMMIIKNTMLDLTNEGKVEFTKLFREWFLTTPPKRIVELRAKANEFLISKVKNNNPGMATAQQIQIDDSFTNLEKDTAFTDMLVAMLICQDLGFTAIFLNATRNDPRVPTIPAEQCMYNIQDNKPVILFLFYGKHYEPIFFLKDDNTFTKIFKRDSAELKPILDMLASACARANAANAVPEKNADLEAAIAASLATPSPQAVGGGGGGGGSSSTPQPPGKEKPRKTRRLRKN